MICFTWFLKKELTKIKTIFSEDFYQKFDPLYITDVWKSNFRNSKAIKSRFRLFYILKIFCSSVYVQAPDDLRLFVLTFFQIIRNLILRETATPVIPVTLLYAPLY